METLVDLDKNVTIANAKLLKTRVIVKRDDPLAITPLGVHLIKNAQVIAVKGTVVKVGPGTDKDPMILEVGERVIFGKFEGSDIEIEGIEYTAMHQESVITSFPGAE